MMFSKKWMIAGAAAGLLISGTTRADGYDSAHRADAKADESTSEKVHATAPMNEGGGSGEIVLPSSDERASTKSRSEKGSSRSDADRGFKSDEDEMAAGNTRGRG